jgi:hypothetical protein
MVKLHQLLYIPQGIINRGVHKNMNKAMYIVQWKSYDCEEEVTAEDFNSFVDMISLRKFS